MPKTIEKEQIIKLKEMAQHVCSLFKFDVDLVNALEFNDYSDDTLVFNIKDNNDLEIVYTLYDDEFNYNGLSYSCNIVTSAKKIFPLSFPVDNLNPSFSLNSDYSIHKDSIHLLFSINNSSSSFAFDDNFNMVSSMFTLDPTYKGIRHKHHYNRRSKEGTNEYLNMQEQIRIIKYLSYQKNQDVVELLPEIFSNEAYSLDQNEMRERMILCDILII